MGIREEYANTGEISPDKLEELYDIAVTIQGITDIEDDLIDPLAIDDIKKASDNLIKVTIFLSPFLPSATSTLSPQSTTGSGFQRRTTLSPTGRHEQRPEEETDQIQEQVFETTRRPVTPLGLLGILNVFDTTLDDLTSSTDPKNLAPYTDSIETAKEKTKIIREEYANTGKIC